MPRRKRTSPTTEDARAKRARATNPKSIRKDTNTAFSSKCCISWFTEYASADREMIDPEGMEKFCEDIGVEPENIVMLCLAWKLGAEQMGFFSLQEWLKGMTELQCDSVAKLQNKLEFLKSLLNDQVTFKSIYRYAFDFAKEKGSRSMEIDTAKLMLALLLGKKWPLFGHFHHFLEHGGVQQNGGVQQPKYKVINKDQWCNVLEFSRLIKPDLSNYDEDGAWPVMLDEFVEWYREQNPSLLNRSAPSDTVMC